MSEPIWDGQGPAPLVPSSGPAVSRPEEGARAGAPGLEGLSGREREGRSERRRCGGSGRGRRGVVAIEDTTSGLRVDGCERAEARDGAPRCSELLQERRAF